MLLNKFMPVYHFNETHRTIIQASPECIFQSLYELTPTDIWLFQVLFGVRFTTRKKFAAYWRLIYPGSALIRRMWLEALKRHAEAKSTVLSEAKI